MLYLTSSVTSLGGQLNEVVITCAFSKGPIATSSLRTANSVTTLLGSTLGPGLVRALRRAPTVIRNKPFTGVTRNYGDIHTAGATLGLTSCIVARTNFNTSLNTRGFFSVGYHVTKLGPSTIMLITAVETLGCGNNIPGSRLSSRGLSTLGTKVMGLRGRVRGLRGFNIPMIIALGSFIASAGTRASFMRRFYGRENYRFTLSRM